MMEVVVAMSERGEKREAAETDMLPLPPLIGNNKSSRGPTAVLSPVSSCSSNDPVSDMCGEIPIVEDGGSGNSVVLGCDKPTAATEKVATSIWDVKAAVEEEKWEVEVEEFLSAAERMQSERFVNKYNYDVVNDVPLVGRYDWAPFMP